MGGMAVYGLGIVLTLTDNASGRLSGVNSSLKNLSQTAMSLTYMGKSLMNTGKALLTPVVALGKEIVRVNADAEKTRITLGALYEDPVKGKEKFMEVMQYAAKTPFRVTELKEAAVTFKTLGVEILGAGADVTSTSGKTKEFMEVLGDLGAGLSGVARRGFADVTYAVKEFVTEGNKLSFLRRLGIDIDTVLGNAGLTVGNTVEERLKNMADMAEILHFEGLTDKMFGTWTQVLSNMGDVWDLFLLGIGDTDTGLFFDDEFGNHVFGGFKRTLDHLQKAMDVFKITALGDAIGKAVFSIIQPLDMIGAKLVDIAKYIADAIIAHPIIAKIAVLLPTIAGALFLIAGAALVAKGSMLVFGYGLGVILGMIPGLLKFGLIFGAISYAWSKDIGGIRTRLTNFVNTLQTSMSRAKEILSMETKDMVREYNNLVNSWDKAGDFGAGFTAQIIKTKVLWGAFIDFLKDNKVDPKTLGILNDMGILGTFEKIATWTARIKDFCAGVVQGFSDIGNAVGNFVNNVMSKFFPKIKSEGKNGLFDMLTGSFNLDKSKDLQGLGNFVAKALPAFLILRRLHNILNRFGNRRNKRGLGDILSGLLGRGTNAKDAVNNTHGFANMLNSLGAIRVGTAMRGIFTLGMIMTAFMGLSTVFGGFINLVGAGTVGKGIMALGALSLAMLPLGTPVFKGFIKTLTDLSEIPVKSILKGVLKLSLIIGAMSIVAMGIAELLKLGNIGFKDIGVLFAFIAVTGVISLIGRALFNMMKDKSLYQTKPKTLLKGLRNLAIAILGMSVIVGVIMTALKLLNVDMADIRKLFAFSLLIGVLGIVGNMLADATKRASKIKFKNFAKGLGELAIAIIGMATIVVLINEALEKFNIDLNLGQLLKLSIAIGSLGTVGGILAGIAGKVGNVNFLVALKGLGIMAIAIVGAIAIFGTIAVALGKLQDYIPRLDEFIDKGSVTLGKVATAIGNFFGSVIGGLGKGLTSSLPDIGSNIAGFVTNLNPLISLARSEDATQIGTFFKSLGSGLLALTKNNLLNAFTGGTDFKGLADDLSGFAKSLRPFFKEVSKVNDDGLNKAPKMFDALSKINNQAFMSGGVNDWWNGKIDLTSLGTQLTNLAKALSPFFTEVGGLDETSFGKAESMFHSLEVINHQAFTQGGVNDWWNGKIDLTNLGTMLSNFASSASTFWTTVATWDESAFSKAGSMFTALKVINDQAFMSGGVDDWWNGKIDLSNLGTMLSDFATNAETFFTTINNFKNPYAIGAIFNALKDVSELNEVQSDNLSTLGTNLSTFMTNANTFFTDAKTVDTSGLTNIATGLTEFFNVINNVVVTGLTSLSGSITSVVSSITSVNGQLLIMRANFITSTTTVGTAMTLMATAVITGCASVTSAISSMCASCQGILSSFASSGYGYGKSLVSNIAAGITGNAGAIRLAIQSAVSSATSSVSVKIPINVGQNATGTMNWAGGLTTINERGGELVDLPQGTRIYPHDKSVTMAFDEGMQTAMEHMARGDNDNRQYDDSIHFHAGSIVVQANGASEAEAERLAELIMTKIEKKRRRKQLANYAY